MPWGRVGWVVIGVATLLTQFYKSIPAPFTRNHSFRSR